MLCIFFLATKLPGHAEKYNKITDDAQYTIWFKWAKNLIKNQIYKKKNSNTHSHVNSLSTLKYFLQYISYKTTKKNSQKVISYLIFLNFLPFNIELFTVDYNNFF